MVLGKKVAIFDWERGRNLPLEMGINSLLEMDRKKNPWAHGTIGVTPIKQFRISVMKIAHIQRKSTYV